MNRTTPILISLAGLLTAASSALGGELNPPAGAVTATGRFGPRTEINQANTPGDADSLFKITQPGSYYLGGNITGVAAKHGIEIASSGVTLDLMGFELLGLPGLLGSLDGVSVTVAVNVRIHDGSVRDWRNGVNVGLARNSSLRDLLAEGNTSSGLILGDGGLVTACTARSNGGIGIVTGKGCTISGNTAYLNTGVGIGTGFGCTISGNSVHSNGSDGILGGSGSTISGNTATFNEGDGIQVSNDCFVLNNTCDSNGFGGDGAGIHVTGGDSRIEGNSVTDNDRGIDVDAAGNFIVRNTASGNTTNYDIVVNNKVGVIVNAPNSAAISGSSGGTGVGTSNPWANFSY